MKEEKIEIIYRGDNQIEVHGTRDAWYDIALVMEALAVLAASSVGKNPHGIDTPQKMNQYIKDYIDKIDYKFVANL